MLSCREFADFLMAYLDDELPGDQRVAFEDHIEECPSCVQFLRTYEETVRLGKCLCADEEGPPPEDAPEQLIQAILAARRRGA
jgi:anti-sigma factor RsiW